MQLGVPTPETNQLGSQSPDEVRLESTREMDWEVTHIERDMETADGTCAGAETNACRRTAGKGVGDDAAPFEEANEESETQIPDLGDTLDI